MPSEKSVYLVSACLLGICTRYDGKQKKNQAGMDTIAGSVYIPFCPEQLGGLPTPREAADITGGDGNDVLLGTAKVTTKSGNDVTEAFLRGAEQTLAIARLQPITAVCLKARSPSCAVSGKIGVTAALLKAHGFKLLEF